MGLLRDEISSATLLCSFAEVDSSHTRLRLLAHLLVWHNHCECRCTKQTASSRNRGGSRARTCAEPVTTPGGRSCDSNNGQGSDEDRPVLSRVLQYVLQRWPEKNAADEFMPFSRQATTRTVLRRWLYPMGYKSHCTNIPSLRANGRTTPETS